MSNLRPEIIAAAAWLQSAIDSTPYGDVSLTFKLHDGRPAVEERQIVQRIKTPTPTGYTGGRHESAR